MKKRKILGSSLILAGLLIFFLQPLGNLTGFVVAKNISSIGGIWIYALGLGLMIAGVVLQVGVLREERQVESPLVSLVTETIPEQARRNCEILIDADFTKALEEGPFKRMALNPNFFGDYIHRISPKVLDEITRPGGSRKQSLVGRNMISYLLGTLKTDKNQLVGFKPTKQESDIIYDLWKQYSPKANFKSEENKFLSSGEREMLCYALRRNQNYTIILSNNYSETGKIAEQLKAKNLANVYALTYRDVFHEESPSWR